MASLTYEDTLLVPRRPLLQPPRRPLSTQFAPARKLRWPWVALAFVWGLAASRPFDNAATTHQLELATTAQSLLGAP